MRGIGIAVDYDRLGDEGFLIKTHGDYLVITSGRLRGAMYGVYTFLEKHLSCRWFTPQVSKIPRVDSWSLAK